jgi:Glu-tRNA(Gln) amidotransferase subunit E-like FAD-binding protein
VPGRSLELLRFEPVRAALDRRGQVRVLLLPGLREFLGWPVGPTRTFADELADQARVIACLDGTPNLLVEEDPRTPGRFWENARKALEAREEDALLLLWGPREDLDTAVAEIESRGREAGFGVPPESRQALPGGETRLERVLPGPDRMYPDTDLPPFPISDARLARIEAARGEPVWEREARLRGLGVAAEDAGLVAVSCRTPLLERIVEESGVPARLAGRVLGSAFAALARRGRTVDGIPDSELRALFRLFAASRFSREGFPAVLARMAEGAAAERAVAEAIGAEADEAEVAEVARAVVAAAPPVADPERRMRHLMGLALRELRGRAAGPDVRRALLAALAEVDRE